MDRKEQLRERREATNNRMKGITGMAMGVIYVAFGIFMFIAKQKQIIVWGKTLTYIVASLIILYGLFRVWRGWKMRKDAER